MAAKTVIEGSTVSASQLKDFFRQIDERSLTSHHLQALLEHRNPFEPRSLSSFDPVALIGEECEVVGDRKALPESFDPSRLKVKSTPLATYESCITGDQAKKRLAGLPLAGVEVFWRCWNKRDNLPVELRGKIIHFDGMSSVVWRVTTSRCACTGAVVGGTGAAAGSAAGGTRSACLRCPQVSSRYLDPRICMRGSVFL